MPEHDLYSGTPSGAKLVTGTFANSASGPGSSVFVWTDDQSGRQKWGPCPGWSPHWTSLDAHTLPAAGGTCLLAFPDDGPNPWIIGW